MNYDPRQFWEERLSEHFDLTGTGETGLSLAYNRACYTLRAEVLDRALREVGFDPDGKHILDVGCGTGFFTSWYRDHGAEVTGLDLTDASIDRLKKRFPNTRFLRADISETAPEGTFDLVNVFDVFFHITDTKRWESAMRNAAGAVAPGGWLAYTDVFREPQGMAAHNVTRPLERHRALLTANGLEVKLLKPTHVLLNRELGAIRFLNRFPGLLLALDRTLLGLGLGTREDSNQLLLASRPAAR
jgi:SAM-dependent methyltransferase